VSELNNSDTFLDKIFANTIKYFLEEDLVMVQSQGQHEFRLECIPLVSIFSSLDLQKDFFLKIIIKLSSILPVLTEQNDFNVTWLVATLFGDIE